jgi:hypothetical protein
VIADDDTISRRSVPEEELEVWKREAQSVALGGYRLILEDGPELSSSSEGSGDEELTGMYAPNCGSIEAARPTEEQARVLQAQGKAGIQSTVSGTQSTDPIPARFE